MKTRSAQILAVALSLPLFASSARAAVYVNLDADPLPLVDITVVIPSGFEAVRSDEVGAGNLMTDIIDAGTQSLDRQVFLDRLASFGASHDFSVANLYSVWKLSFPVVEGKDYSALGDLVAENWNSPRLTDESFQVARRKLEAALKGGLDSDGSLGTSTTRRWINKRQFGGYPLTIDALAGLKRETVATVWNRDFKGAQEAWAGVVAPESSLPLVRAILAKVFKGQGELIENAEPRPLKLREVSSSGLKADRVFLILDKPGRTQTMTSLISVSAKRHGAQEELATEFGNHILVNSGLGSVFGEEIRTKRGLAYSVGGVQPFYLGYPSLGLAANPVRPKTDEALGVIAELVKGSYVEGTTVSKLADEVWKRQWKSFIYGKLMDRSSPDGRISERMDVAIGAMSPERYAQKITDWKTDASEVAHTLQNTWSSSVVVGAVVGEAKELKPMLEKHFPSYRIVVIPYQESILSKTY